MKLFGTLCAYCLVAVVLPGEADAQNYTFTNIADNTGPFSGFGPPKLNNAGGISFYASIDAVGSGIFRTDGVDITTIADYTGPNYPSNGYTDINDAGQVAFIASNSIGDSGIFRGDGWTTTKIAAQSTSLFFGSFYTQPRINNGGQVAFYAFDYNSAAKFINVGNGGNLTIFADAYGPLGEFFSPSINNFGTVAFAGGLDSSGIQGIFRSNGGAISTLIDNTGPYDAFSPYVAINDNGVVAAVANLDEGGQAILRIDGSIVDVIAGPPNVVLNSGFVGLNNSGDVSFVAALSPTVNAILTGPDPVADKVIADGDPLFGSTIKPNYFNDFIDGPNDAGQIVFSYLLVDGRGGIALATPIAEPLCIGDYNGDGKVSAADYTVWRDNLGAAALTNRDPDNIGLVGIDDYNSWISHFGESNGSGSGISSSASFAIPEPASTTLVFVLLLVLTMSDRRRT